MIIRAKLGTGPAGFYETDTGEEPKVGDRFKLRLAEQGVNRLEWRPVRVCEIKHINPGDKLYYLERF